MDGGTLFLKPALSLHCKYIMKSAERCTFYLSGPLSLTLCQDDPPVLVFTEMPKITASAALSALQSYLHNTEMHKNLTQ